MKYALNVKYRIGQVLKTEDRKYTLIGYEYIESRAMRYIYLTVDHGKPDWIYLFDFEVDALKT